MSDDRAATPALVAEDLVEVYAGGARALNGLRLAIPQGSFFGLLSQDVRNV